MTSTTFDETAFELLPKTTEPLQRMRKQAFEEFRALPIPSQETEEWRYIDLADFELSFEPHVPGGVRTTSVQDLDGPGIVFTDLDEADESHADLVERTLHTLVPTDRTKFTALHGAFRTGGTFLYVPRDVRVELPLQTLTYLDVDDAAAFPHTLL